ncbi:hypothetical protein PVAP13_1KG557860 [Panicum virgatum]|uniref:peroxidase n=1 Tax=Panicum virgatum TaxID=38727 RepID=A0A8T0XSU0_PANVG|nr:hypothetical protein PVAP13_1KG557860 [Panicum virgatum]
MGSTSPLTRHEREEELGQMKWSGWGRRSAWLMRGKLVPASSPAPTSSRSQPGTPSRCPVARRGSCPWAAETSTLPGPRASFEQLKQAFHARGLSTKDLAVLSGGHTLGFAHCSSFQDRIHPAAGDDKAQQDPSLSPSFAASLRRACPANNTARAAGSGLDATSAAFDNTYYRMLQGGRGLLASDEALLTHPKTRAWVALYAASQEAFFRAFAKSMLRMGGLNGGDEV